MSKKREYPEGVIIRINHTHATVEASDRTIFSVKREMLPPNFKKGDFIRMRPDGSMYEIDLHITSLRDEEIQRIREDNYN